MKKALGCILSTWKTWAGFSGWPSTVQKVLFHGMVPRVWRAQLDGYQSEIQRCVLEVGIQDKHKER